MVARHTDAKNPVEALGLTVGQGAVDVVVRHEGAGLVVVAVAVQPCRLRGLDACEYQGQH